MLKKMIKKGRKIMKDMVKNEAEVIEAKKTVVIELSRNQSICEFLAAASFGIGISVGAGFLLLARRAAQYRKDDRVC